MNSSVAFWPLGAFSEVRAVFTTMPSVAVVVQAAWSFGIPSISTRHMRQAPMRLAEPRLVTEHGNLDAGGERRLDEAVPFGTCTSRSSTVTVRGRSCVHLVRVRRC